MLRYLPLLPILLYQGIRVRLTTPRLPDASAPFTGQIAGGNSQIRLVVLGESTVAGVGVDTHEQAITGQIAHALAQKTGCGVQWQALGGNGYSAQEAHDEFVPQLTDHNADIVVLMLGVNNTNRLHSPRRWSDELTSLIDAIRERLPNVPIVISAVPPIRDFPVLPQPLRRFLGERAQALDEATGILVAPMNDVIHVPFPPNMTVTPEYFCADKLHPSAKGYTVWGEYLAEAIATIFF